MNTEKIDYKKWFTILVLIIVYGICLFMKEGRTFFVFIGGSYIFALIYFRIRGESAKVLWDPKVWLHRTSLNEAYILLIAIVTVTLIANGGTLFAQSTYAHAFYNMYHNLHLPVITTQPTTFSAILYFIATLLAHEAAYYCSHRILHNRVMWEFHKVHHSALVMTPFTSLRQHPVELMLNIGMNSLFLGLTAATFVYFYPSEETLMLILDSGLVLAAFLVLGGSLAHSHAWISYGPVIDKHVISPAMHQIHHSTNPRHYEKNFGFMLTCFDKWFGTLYIPPEKEDLTFGLGNKEDEDFTNIKGSTISPFTKAYKKIGKKPKKKKV